MFRSHLALAAILVTFFGCSSIFAVKLKSKQVSRNSYEHVRSSSLTFNYFAKNDSSSSLLARQQKPAAGPNYKPRIICNFAIFDRDHVDRTSSNDGDQHMLSPVVISNAVEQQHRQLQSFHFSQAARLTDEQRLMIKLFTHYDRSVRPVRNWSDPIIIKLSLTLMQIFEVDERNQMLITNVWANYEWTDQYLKWDPAEFSNLEMVRMLSSKLWLPDIFLYNNAADYNKPTEYSQRAMVSYTGLVFWSQPTKLLSSCKVDVTYFPFDEQTCILKFGSWTYDGFRLDFDNTTESADLSLYIESGQWDLVSAAQRRHVVYYSCCIEPYPATSFYIHIRRKSFYYFLNIFLPCYLMSALTLFVFLLPAESNEKCGLGVTTMLSFAVFLLTVVEKLPESSDSFPLIVMFLTVVMTMTATSVICTVMVLGLNYGRQSKGRMPLMLRRLLDRFAPVCCVHGPSRTSINKTHPAVEKCKLTPSQFLRQLTREMSNKVGEPGRESDLQTQCPYKLYRDIINGINRVADRQYATLRDQSIGNDWRRLAQLIDRGLFCSLLFGISTFTVYILILLPSEQHDHPVAPDPDENIIMSGKSQ